jgi:hypothetical protein
MRKDHEMLSLAELKARLRRFAKSIASSDWTSSVPLPEGRLGLAVMWTCW